MLSLMDQALRKVKEGETTLDEAIRISGGEELDFDELF
jgi:type II secretory ATPase GspE/PulE/Tfp pilus assembly ATPase PilB-like protein